MIKARMQVANGRCANSSMDCLIRMTGQSVFICRATKPAQGEKLIHGK